MWFPIHEDIVSGKDKHLVFNQHRNKGIEDSKLADYIGGFPDHSKKLKFKFLVMLNFYISISAIIYYCLKYFILIPDVPFAIKLFIGVLAITLYFPLATFLRFARLDSLVVFTCFFPLELFVEFYMFENSFNYLSFFFAIIPGITNGLTLFATYGRKAFLKNWKNGEVNF